MSFMDSFLSAYTSGICPDCGAEMVEVLTDHSTDMWLMYCLHCPTTFFHMRTTDKHLFPNPPPFGSRPVPPAEGRFLLLPYRVYDAPPSLS